MKHIFSSSIAFVAALLTVLSATVSLNATQYCDAALSSRDGHNATVTMRLVSAGMYEFSITTEDNIQSFNAAGSNFYAEINGVGGYHVSEHLVQSGNTLSVVMESNVKPHIYVGDLFIVLEGIGEDMFTIPGDADWEACSTDDTEYTITVVQPAAGGTIAANATASVAGALVTLTATPDEGKQLDAWDVKDAEDNAITVSKAGQFIMPAAAVTVTATFKDKVELTPATFSGTDVQAVATFNWSITRNADQTLTLNISWDSDLEGVAPQVTIGDKMFLAMTLNGKSATYTTADTYEDGDKPTIFFYIAYAGNAARVDVDYTVGASNATTALVPTVSAKSVSKTLKDGQLLITVEGKCYDVMGTVVR